jgi:L-lactate dehydrogenase complex protein LldG
MGEAEAKRMSARDAVLARIRRSLGVSGADPARRDAVAVRLAEAPRGPNTPESRLDRAARLRLFVERAESVKASVARVATPAQVPAAVAEYLRRNNLPAAIRHGDDPRLKALPWRTTPQLSVATGRAEPDDPTGLSHADAGIAESGSVILASGLDNPTTLNFLPENHIVVVAGGDLVGDYETGWERVRARHPGPLLPRAVNFITGPSRSADIEQTIQLGAHGPRRLHIILVEGT